jgi:hypothetical protein
MIKCDSDQLGYMSSDYAESLSEFGQPVHLPRCGGNLLIRSIPETSLVDAMGCYPLFFCDDWQALAVDLEDLPEEVVSVSLVADPYGSFSRHTLDACFDVVNPFKEHYIVDLRKPHAAGSRSHRKHARRALKDIQVEVCMDPENFVDDWGGLYQNLKRRYNIEGIRGFSKRAFAKQLGMPEMTVLQAFYRDEIIGAQLYYVQDGIAYCHLGAVSDVGYRVGAFYAMDYYSFEYFSDSARKLDLGGGAGLSGSNDDGLSYYKEGWCTETRPVYFCGRILDPERYAALTALRNQEKSGYFPAYRAGEFA